uniref:NADH-ubiquinone oxidoreductase chain 2 n=1 Tax=Teliapsocus conterminus TaxID=1407779 RepID=A0A8K1ZG80_9NEOP|nr:NADH dehydrogenase subunit 2 [Teliapsocus conterminus]
MMNNLNIIFLVMTMFGSIMSISSMNWFSAWLGLEINLISFVPLIVNNKNNSITEAAMKYFVIQASASAMFIFICLVNSMNNFYSMIFLETPNFMLILIPLMVKLGASPFQEWFIMIMQKMDWFKCFMLSTMQKIAPLFLINFLMLNYNLILTFAILSSMVGSIGGLKQTSFKKIMAYSSVNHLGWMLTTIVLSKQLLICYFMFYSMMNLYSMTILYKMNMNSLTQQFKYNFYMEWVISMMSLSGLPPLIGFLPKWLVIQTLISNSMFLITSLLIATALITLLFYMRMITASLTINFSQQKWVKTLNFKKMSMNTLMLIVTLSGLMIYNLILN